MSQHGGTEELSSTYHRSTNEMLEPRTVVLIDPETLVRFAIKSLIDSLEGYEVVAEGSDMNDALSLIEKHNPDILVSEVALPGPSGLELLLEIQRRNLTKIRTLIVSQVDSADMVRQALLAGAQGYVLKRGDFENLVHGLDATKGDKKFLPPEMESLAEMPANAYELSKARPDDPLAPLSPREREIFHLLANGLQNTVIAKKLFISPRTVETHRARIVRKLGLTSNGELIRFAIKHGLTVV